MIAGHQDSSNLVICRSMRATVRWAARTRWKARLQPGHPAGQGGPLLRQPLAQLPQALGLTGVGLGRAGRPRTMRRRGVVMSGALDDLELDAAVLERLLGDGVALLAGLELGTSRRRTLGGSGPAAFCSPQRPSKLS